MNQFDVLRARETEGSYCREAVKGALRLHRFSSVKKVAESMTMAGILAQRAFDA